MIRHRRLLPWPLFFWMSRIRIRNHFLCRIYCWTRPSANAKCAGNTTSRPCTAILRRLFLPGIRNLSTSLLIKSYHWNSFKTVTYCSLDQLVEEHFCELWMGQRQGPQPEIRGSIGYASKNIFDSFNELMHKDLTGTVFIIIFFAWD